MRYLDKYHNLGLFILRVGIGVMFLTHGGPKLFGGPEKWEKVGMAIGNLGIHFLPVFWGFMAAASEFCGGICLILGLFVRPASALMMFTMIVATVMHLRGGDGLKGASHAVESGILFFSMIFIGAGKYSLDELFFRDKNKS